MPDQSTPVTDDDRKAHEWCDSVEQNPNLAGDKAHAAARAIRAHVPAPPATLADELREAANDPTVCTRVSIDVRSLADRVEAVERERDEARAEVERLTRERDDALTLSGDLFDALPRTATPDPDLSDPADVPRGEPWLVRYEGKEMVGIRSNRDDDITWRLIPADKDYAVRWASDTDVTLVSRLVPDVRRVIDRPEDLDALPEWSVVLDKSGRPWYRTKDGYWAFGLDRYKADYMLHFYGPVTVIHEPMVDSVRRS